MYIFSSKEEERYSD